MPALPPTPNAERLADWLEMFALESHDRNASLSDLERALNRDPGGETKSHQQAREKLENQIAQVAREVRERMRAAQDAYPFSLIGGKLQFKGQTPATEAYLFCLFISTVSWSSEKFKKQQAGLARRLFEHLACVAARNYVGGDSLRFGSPRSTMPKRFSLAVNALCARLGEGDGYKAQPSLERKDDGLDVVAWKHFPDERPGKLILLGQCATGDDWDSKLGDLSPNAFCQHWMTDTPASKLLPAFFLPHRVPYERWNHVSRKCGIVFDRCRIAQTSGVLPGEEPYDQIGKWVAKFVTKVTA
jgi:hypothetical protein